MHRQLFSIAVFSILAVGRRACEFEKCFSRDIVYSLVNANNTWSDCTSTILHKPVSGDSVSRWSHARVVRLPFQQALHVLAIRNEHHLVVGLRPYCPGHPPDVSE